MARYTWIAIVLVALLALCGAVEADTELNPSEYVPLEVGNRWTYEHVYRNDVYMMNEDEYGEGKFYVIPGSPPDSLRYAENIVTIEITHTEVIDGLEYFVFSNADYAWPPLPELFWGGKKVRLSDEGVLVFHWDEQILHFFGASDEEIAAAASRWEEQGLPLYDFGRPSDGFGGYTRTRARLSRVFFHFYDFHFYNIPKPVVPLAEVGFLQGYGVGPVYMELISVGMCVGAANLFLNELTPISAVISGREIDLEQVRPFYFSFQSTGIGQVAQVRIGEGFDFSQGTHSESSNDVELLYDYDVEDLFFYDDHSSGKLACSPPPNFPPLLRSSETGVTDLGKIDFGLLISQGIPPDRPLDFATTWWVLYEGHTYAVQSREGGVALLYVFDAEFNEEDYKLPSYPPSLEHIKFDWVYYPDGLPDKDTAVQPMSWGQVKARPQLGKLSP